MGSAEAHGDFHCVISSFMVDTMRELSSVKKNLHSSTEQMRREIAAVYERLKTLEVECFRDAIPLRHRVVELEMQEELLGFLCDDHVNGEHRVRSRLFELSSELFDLQKSRDDFSSSCEFDALEKQQHEIDFRIAAINVLRDHIYASNTNQECVRIGQLIETLDEGGRILQVGRDVREINELRDRASKIRVVQRVAVKRIMHQYGLNLIAHSGEMARLHHAIADRRRRVHELRRSIHEVFRGDGARLVRFVRTVSTYTREIARIRDMFSAYDANAARIWRLQARQTELNSDYNRERGCQ